MIPVDAPQRRAFRGPDIDHRSIEHSQGLRLVASGPDFALLSTFVPTLPNTVLVQLVRLKHAGRYSLYTVYREGDVTFDAIARFDIGEQTGRLAEVLEDFVRTTGFESLVLRPIVDEVEAHFCR